jgi:hypothetical protein
LEFLLSALAQLIDIFLEQILAAYESIANDAWAYITGDDQFNLSVADAIAIRPALVFHLLYAHIRPHHRGATQH